VKSVGGFYEILCILTGTHTHTHTHTHHNLKTDKCCNFCISLQTTAYVHTRTKHYFNYTYDLSRTLFQEVKTQKQGQPGMDKCGNVDFSHSLHPTAIFWLRQSQLNAFHLETALFECHALAAELPASWDPPPWHVWLYSCASPLCHITRLNL